MIDRSQLEPEPLARSIVDYLAGNETMDFENLIQLDGAKKASVILQRLLKPNLIAA
jgi:hypothetical protein